MSDAGSEIEWLDAGPPPRVGPTGRPGRSPWRWWYALVALGLVGAALISWAVRHDGKSTAGRPSPSPSAPASPSPSASPSSPATSAPNNPGAAASAVTVVNVGRPLVNVPAGWNLFGRVSGGVIRLQLAEGLITTTTFPLLSSDGPVSLLAGPDRVVVQPLDNVPGYVVQDGRPAAELAETSGKGGPALPGPDPDHFWVPTTSGATTTLRLIGFDGTQTNTTMTVPADASSLSPDHAGYVVFYGTGGIYDARPSGITRITSGQLHALGPTRWLSRECDAAYHCTVQVTDRATGAHRVLNVPISDFTQGGVISPDGSRAAVLEGDSNSPATVHLIDLNTGTDRATSATLDPNLAYQEGIFVWSPDGKWLFVTNGTGRLFAIEASAGTVVAIDTGAIGPVSQLALRTDLS